MTAEMVIEALDIPQGARVDQRIAKKLLIENVAATASDKRHINEGIEELIWVAALKPNTVGVPEYRDDSREVLEIAVLHLILREGAKVTRVVELIHRAIPYPTFLVTTSGDGIALSLATKRWSQNEGGKTVLDEEPLTVEIEDESQCEPFLTSLSLRHQKRPNLHELYLNWKVQFEAFQTSAYTGVFSPSLSSEVAEKRKTALVSASAIQQELISLRAKAERETQMNRRVQSNLDIKRLEEELRNAIKDME